VTASQANADGRQSGWFGFEQESGNADTDLVIDLLARELAEGGWGSELA